MTDGVCLSLEMRKSAGKTDSFGNYIFEVEASNENLDLQNQIVLQNALLESRDEFLRNGVISYDHLHKRRGDDGSTITDPAMVIGEPIDVKTDGSSTIVVGKLYTTNEKAKEIIKLLKAGSTRIKASVGGIFPKIIKDARTGVEKVVHVLWNDLALTVSPVNRTVGSAEFAKALSPSEFVFSLPDEMRKALSAGYETDSAAIEGGRSLIGEDVQAAVVVAAPEEAGEEVEKKAIEEAIRRLRSHEISGSGQAEAVLVSFGIGEARAAEIVREILEQGEEMMKGSFSKHISNLLKSLSPDEEEMREEEEELDTEEKSCVEGEKVIEKADGEEKELDELEDEDFEEEDEEELGDEDFEDDEGDEDEDDGVPLDGGEMMKALSAELRAMKKSQRLLRSELKGMREMQDNMARVLADTAQAVQRMGDEPLPPKSVLNKSFSKGEKELKPSQSDLDTVNEILVKAVKDGKIDLFRSSLISSDFQKSMVTGMPMKKEFYDFLQAEYAAGRN